MGSSQSSHASKGIANNPKDGVRGRKSRFEEAPHGLAASLVSEPSAFVFSHDFTVEEVSIPTSIEEEDTTESEYESDDDEEDDEEWEERLQILEDARNLKKVAGFFLHPEAPVVGDGLATARCFFDRPSASERLPVEDAEEEERIMKDLKALKKVAIDYLHPEKPVVGSEAGARCYFDRASAERFEDAEEAKERDATLQDMKALKKLAVDYWHPELPVAVVDPTVFGRNYFARASAVEAEDLEEAEERARVLVEAKALKKLAVDYMHPERPVVVEDAALFGRNYFGRASAGDQEEAEEAERAAILADAVALKKLAVDYMHPELPVSVTDPTMFGRNYFTRASAVEEEDVEEAEERARVIGEAKALKKLAVDYMHPERPVVLEDATVFGRNYFTRPSAELMEDAGEADEQARALSDAKALKKLAVDYMHPERPVVVEDAALFGRNYFGRASAGDQENAEEAEERAAILADALALNKLAVDYMHPELPVSVADPTVFGRNYFTRASAVEKEDVEEAEERARVIAEAKALKKLAVDYMHPERPVVVEDATVFGRNYFTRPSAEAEDAEEHVRILEDMKALKKLAVAYMHPELPVATMDPTLFGRNYFSRPSAELMEDADEAGERARVLAEAKALKKVAVDYLHPEMTVTTTDPAAFGRNYFSRPSAEPTEDAEETKERELVLAEAQALKELAVAYKHPELPVVTSDPSASGRNYFDRPSAYGHYQMVHTFPAHEDDEHHDDHHHEHLDHFGMDEDMDHMFDDIREHFNAPAEGKTTNKNTAGSEEGNLSRSPSSVMLFTDEPIYE